MKVILDRAHGSNVKGKSSPDGRKEWQWSDRIVTMLSQRLISAGHQVYKTCYDDKEPGLQERVRRMNVIQSPAIVVSLHNNAAGMGDKWMKARGYSLWTSKGKTKSDKLADELYSLLRREFPELPFRADWSDNDSDYDAHFTVLTSKHPSVMLEWMFQDNQEDVEVIWDDSYNQRLVNVLVQWINNVKL